MTRRALREADAVKTARPRRTAAPVTPTGEHLVSEDDQLQKQAERSRDAGSGANQLAE